MEISGRLTGGKVGTRLALECFQCKYESWIAGSVSWERGVCIEDALSECGSDHSRKNESAEFQCILAAVWMEAEERDIGPECDSSFSSSCHIILLELTFRASCG
ncbi:MAG: hypothetical protein EZS28_056253 [Streblomastix strix]|uniref:Uncharacterized protein n=1 Tax=Streblomastix strix TaxID=222440 RepID=A0A5J4PMH4_9EUKA|nr:MAG: hypothetical protein EZS28_056253 [Streblomastix strix]